METAKVAIGLNRKSTGFEISKNAFEYQIKEMHNIKKGYLLSTLREPEMSQFENRGKYWDEKDNTDFKCRYAELKLSHKKKDIIEILTKEFKRGRFAIIKKIDSLNNDDSQIALFNQ